MREATQKLRDNVARSANAYDAAIFDAHVMFLNDPELLDRARTMIFHTAVFRSQLRNRPVEEVVDAAQGV